MFVCFATIEWTQEELGPPVLWIGVSREDAKVAATGCMDLL